MEAETEMPKPNPIRVRYERMKDSVTGAHVHIGGLDISKMIRSIAFEHSAGELPQVHLTLTSKADLSEVDQECLVYIRETVLEDPMAATLRFLEPLDPGEFERSCLAALEGGELATFGEAALFVLRGYAGGQ